MSSWRGIIGRLRVSSRVFAGWRLGVGVLEADKC